MLASVTLGAAFVSNGGSVPRRASLLVARGRQDDGALLTRIDECMTLDEDGGDADDDACSVDEMQALHDKAVKRKRADQRGRGGVAEGSASLYDEVARSLKVSHRARSRLSRAPPSPFCLPHARVSRAGAHRARRARRGCRRPPQRADRARMARG